MKIVTKSSSLLLLLLLLFSSTSCRKDNHVKPEDQLPAATQEGKNTLGFLLNGEPWTPKGFNGTANLSLDYDAGYKKGVLGIAAYQIISDTNREYFGIGVSDSLNFIEIPTTLSLNDESLIRILFSNNSCEYFSTDTDTYTSGNLIITQLDATKERVIISGKFNATLYKPGCDTIRITKGRFDMSLH